jgi:hypothetical protein
MTEFDNYEHLNSDSNIGKPELETLDYKPEQPKCKTCDVCGEKWSPRHFWYCKGKKSTEQPITSKEEAEEVARELFKVSEQPVGCPDLETAHLGIPNKTEQPNPNAMVFEQIEGCCDIIDKLLKELKPQTDDVKDCMVTHKSWRVNNLKHLKEAFE